MLKCDEFLVFTNTLKTYKVVSKKFGDVKKISLFERSEFEIFSRRAFCVLMGRAPARAMGSGGGGLRRGSGASPAPGSPSLERIIKASAFNKFY